MKTYTIEELTALSDADLNALAAELRGWHVALGAVDTLAGETVHEHHWEGRGNEGELGAIISLLDWQPATDRNQSGELLEWAAAQPMRAKFTVDFDSERGMGVEWGVRLADYCAVCDTEIPSFECDGFCACECHKQPCGTIPGNTARSETIAFCAAMQAIQNAQGGASE